MHGEHDVVGCRQRHELEVLERIVGDLVEEDWIDRKAVDVEQDGVAVRWRLRDLHGADAAARAADILDIELLAELLAELLHDEPRENVGRAAGCERHDDAHGPRGISLRPDGARSARQYRARCQKPATRKLHGSCPREAFATDCSLAPHVAFVPSGGATATPPCPGLFPLFLAFGCSAKSLRWWRSNPKLEGGLPMRGVKFVVVSAFASVLAASGAQAQQTPAPPPLPQAPNMTFFVTGNGPGKGADLGGIEGADRYCQTLA